MLFVRAFNIFVFMVFTNYQNFVFSQLFNFQVTNKYGEWLAVMLCYWFDNYGTSILFEIVMDDAQARRSKRRLILNKKELSELK